MRIGFIASLQSGEVLRRFVDRGADADIGRAAAEIADHRVRRYRHRSAFCSSRATRSPTSPVPTGSTRIVERRASARPSAPPVPPSSFSPSIVVIRAPALIDDNGVWHERARFSIDVHGAGAAQRHAAAIFGASQVEVVAQDPQERRVAGNVRADVDTTTVDDKGRHCELHDSRVALLETPRESIIIGRRRAKLNVDTSVTPKFTGNRVRDRL